MQLILVYSCRSMRDIAASALSNLVPLDTDYFSQKGEIDSYVHHLVWIMTFMLRSILDCVIWYLLQEHWDLIDYRFTCSFTKVDTDGYWYGYKCSIRSSPSYR